jgi:hypothetical protein
VNKRLSERHRAGRELSVFAFHRRCRLGGRNFDGGGANWQDLRAEEGNSSFDVRHKVSGTYLYELPFGKDKHWVTGGTARIFWRAFSVSGSYTVATGTPLTPSYAAAIADVARGTAGSLRPDRVPG